MTLVFPPASGKTVRIELTGPPRDLDSFGNIIEITGKKDLDSGQNEQKGILNIVEVEIYSSKGAGVNNQ